MSDNELLKAKFTSYELSCHLSDYELNRRTIANTFLFSLFKVINNYVLLHRQTSFIRSFIYFVLSILIRIHACYAAPGFSTLTLLKLTFNLLILPLEYVLL